MPQAMHAYTSLVRPSYCRVCCSSTQMQHLARVSLVPRIKSRGQACSAAWQSAQEDSHVPVGPDRAGPSAGAAAGIAASSGPAAPAEPTGRRRRRDTSNSNSRCCCDSSLPAAAAVAKAADEAAHAAAQKALQLYPHLTAIFNSSSTADELQDTGVTISGQQWTIRISAQDARGGYAVSRGSYGPVTDDHSCLVAAAAADLARLALHGARGISDAKLPSIFGDFVGHHGNRMMLNLPLRLYSDHAVICWRSLLRLEQPDMMLQARAAPHQQRQHRLQQQAAGGTQKRYGEEGSQNPLTAPHGRQKHRQQELRQQLLLLQQQPQFSKLNAAVTPRRSRQPRAAHSTQKQQYQLTTMQIKAAAAEALAAAVQCVVQYTQEQPEAVGHSAWACQDDSQPPRGSCVNRRHGHTWRARITLPGKEKWDVQFQWHCRSPLEAAVAADLARLALHGRRAPSTSGCLWNFPIELYTDDQIRAFGLLMWDRHPDALLNGVW